MPNRILNAAIAGPAVLASLTLLMLLPVQADGVRSTTCVGGVGSVSCVTAWRRGTVGDPHVIQVAPRSEKETAEIEERDRLWRTRCKPVVQTDAFGVGRYTYAARGCEYGRVD
jgi:hypothetical protein